MRFCSTSSKLTSLKNGCLLISSASALVDPRRRVGSRVKSWGKHVINDENVGLTLDTNFLQDRYCVSRHGNWVKRLIFQNGVKDLIFIITAKW